MFAALFFIVAMVKQCQGHGYLYEPPSRSSGWRQGYSMPINYNDNGLNCGTIDVQWKQNEGKCGLCGDNWAGPRNYERPYGSYVQHNIIPRSYQEQGTITIRLVITKNHLGWNEFRICDIAQSGDIEATQDCLNQNLLADAQGRTRFYFNSDQGDTFTQDLDLDLPSGLTCAHCLLQWKWKGGQNWGCDENGCGKGYGEYQEEYHGCADVAVLPKSLANFTLGTGGASTSTTPSTSTAKPTTSSTTPTISTTSPTTPSTTPSTKPTMSSTITTKSSVSPTVDTIKSSTSQSTPNTTTISTTDPKITPTPPPTERPLSSATQNTAKQLSSSPLIYLLTTAKPANFINFVTFRKDPQPVNTMSLEYFWINIINRNNNSKTNSPK